MRAIPILKKILLLILYWHHHYKLTHSPQKVENITVELRVIGPGLQNCAAVKINYTAGLDTPDWGLLQIHADHQLLPILYLDP